LKTRAWTDLVLTNLLVLILSIVVIAFPSNILRLILGVPFILFFPGYILIAALFPRKESMDNLHRVVFSVGMSIAVVPLIGLIINYTPWGITLESVLGSTAVFIAIMSIVTWMRRKQFSEGEQFGIGFHLNMLGLEGGTWNKVLIVLLATSVLGVMAAAGYTIATPQEDNFTEFYLLGDYGEARDYPRNAIIGHEVEVTAGIINHENETVRYRLVVMLDNTIQTEISSISLAEDEAWEQVISITPDKLGENQELAMLLYREGSTEIYRGPLRLWINVTMSAIGYKKE
jgi:uncharacterized membrane protein